jgi:hypothetical protein
MNKADVRLAKKKILECLTEDFDYGKTKSGKPRKRPLKNQAIFDKQDGHGMYHDIDLEMVMDKVILGLYFAMDDSS